MATEIDPDLLRILACPEDKGSVLYVPGECIYNPRLHKAYPIRKGIPVMLVSEATEVSDSEHERIMGIAIDPRA